MTMLHQMNENNQLNISNVVQAEENGATNNDAAIQELLDAKEGCPSNFFEPMKSWPQINDSAFFGIAGEIAREIANISEVDPAAVLASTLVCAAASFGNRSHYMIGDKKHPPKLFAVIAGATAKARKGTSFAPVEKIFYEASKYCQAEKLVIRSGGVVSGEGITYHVRDANGDDPGVSDKRLLIVEEEFGSLFALGKRDGNTISTTFRTIWDKEDFVNLSKNDPYKATGHHVNVLGHITNDELATRLARVDVYNGFANRFLWFCARRQKLVPRPGKLPSDRLNRFAKHIGAAIDFAQGRALTESIMDSNCEKLWDKKYPELSKDQFGAYGAITARSEAQVIRIALVMSLLDNCTKIEEKHLEAALAVWDYCDQSARYLFAAKQENGLQEKILEALRSGEKTSSDLHKALNNNCDSEELAKELENLQSVGRIDSKKSDSGGRGRKPTFWYLRAGFTPS